MMRVVIISHLKKILLFSYSPPQARSNVLRLLYIYISIEQSTGHVQTENQAFSANVNFLIIFLWTLSEYVDTSTYGR